MVLEKGEKDLARILKELSGNTEYLPMYMLIYYWMEMLYAVKQIHDNGNKSQFSKTFLYTEMFLL